MSKQKIIFLNGPGSCGKTSIANCIQAQSEQLWLKLGIDTLIDCLPAKEQGGPSSKIYSFETSAVSGEQVAKVIIHPEGHHFFDRLADIALTFLEQGYNVILDEVIMYDSRLVAYINKLESYTVYSVGVFCDLEVLCEREKKRGDRIIGLSRDQFYRVHQGLREYDLEVNTTDFNQDQCASQILDFIKNNPKPKAFVKMQKFI